MLATYFSPCHNIHVYCISINIIVFKLCKRDSLSRSAVVEKDTLKFQIHFFAAQLYNTYLSQRIIDSFPRTLDEKLLLLSNTSFISSEAVLIQRILIGFDYPYFKVTGYLPLPVSLSV